MDLLTEEHFASLFMAATILITRCQFPDVTVGLLYTHTLAVPLNSRALYHIITVISLIDYIKCLNHIPIV